jgi:hypothetical protein
VRRVVVDALEVSVLREHEPERRLLVADAAQRHLARRDLFIRASELEQRYGHARRARIRLAVHLHVDGVLAGHRLANDHALSLLLVGEPAEDVAEVVVLQVHVARSESRKVHNLSVRVAHVEVNVVVALPLGGHDVLAEGLHGGRLRGLGDGLARDDRLLVED